MFRTIMFIAILALIMPSTVPAMEKGGVTIPDTMKLEGDTGELLLNGTGIRKKLGFKVYVGGVYLKEKTSDSQKIIDADEPMAITMSWLRNVDAKSINETFTDGFKYGAGGRLGALQGDIDTFLGSIGDAAKKDVWRIVYVPGQGTSVFTGDQLSVTIPGAEFKKALFAVWLLESDAFAGDEGLRNGMLGK